MVPASCRTFCLPVPRARRCCPPCTHSTNVFSRLATSLVYRLKFPPLGDVCLSIRGTPAPLSRSSSSASTPLVSLLCVLSLSPLPHRVLSYSSYHFPLHARVVFSLTRTSGLRSHPLARPSPHCSSCGLPSSARSVAALASSLSPSLADVQFWQSICTNV